MAKRIEIDGKFYRYRRGKLVEIPIEWVNRVTSRQTIRQRNSKLPGSLKRRVKGQDWCGEYKDKRDALKGTD